MLVNKSYGTIGDMKTDLSKEIQKLVKPKAKKENVRMTFWVEREVGEKFRRLTPPNQMSAVVEQLMKLYTGFR